jgi:hypothetical protein
VGVAVVCGDARLVLLNLNEVVEVLGGFVREGVILDVFFDNFDNFWELER